MVGMGRVYHGDPSNLSSGSSSTSASVTILSTSVNGTHDFKVTEYSLSKGMGIGIYVVSDTFMVGGYINVWALFDMTLKDHSGKERRKAEDVVALLLKHSRGYSALDEEDIRHETEDEPQGSHHNNSRRKQKKPKKTLGPERPMFFTPQSDNDTWVPPEGQSGDDAHH